MADYRRDHEEGPRWHERDWSARTGETPRRWFGDAQSRQRRGNDERDDRFPYGGDRAARHDEWRVYPDGYREDRASRWEAPRDDRDHDSSYATGGYRTDDRGYHDRYRAQGHRDRDDNRFESWRGSRDARNQAADEYYRAAREQRDDYMRWEAQSYAGRGPKDYQRSDDRVREEVCDCMTDDPLLDASEIVVQVSSGVVTLSGTVTSREQKRRAEDVADRITGVKDVTNQLRVTREANGHTPAALQPVTQSGSGTPGKSTSSTSA